MVAICCLGLVGCVFAASPPRGETLRASKIGFVTMRDCLMPDQSDCHGSGVMATAVFARVFGHDRSTHTKILPRPVSPIADFPDGDACELARSQAFQYVVNGEVRDYRDMPPVLSVRIRDRAGVWVRLLDVRDCSILASVDDVNTGPANGSPEPLLQELAESLFDSVP